MGASATECSSWNGAGYGGYELNLPGGGTATTLQLQLRFTAPSTSNAYAGIDYLALAGQYEASSVRTT